MMSPYCWRSSTSGQVSQGINRGEGGGDRSGHPAMKLPTMARRRRAPSWPPTAGKLSVSWLPWDSLLAQRGRQQLDGGRTDGMSYLMTWTKVSKRRAWQERAASSRSSSGKTTARRSSRCWDVEMPANLNGVSIHGDRPSCRWSRKSHSPDVRRCRSRRSGPCASTTDTSAVTDSRVA